MSDKTKLPVLIILILLMVVSLLLAFAEYRLLQKEKVTSFALKQDLEDLKLKQGQAQKELDDSKQIISDLRAQLEQAQAKLDALNTALAEEKTAKEDALSQVKQLGNYLDKQKDVKVELESRINKAIADLEGVRGKLKESEAKKAELEQKIKDLEAKIEDAQVEESQQDQDVELGTIQVSPESEMQASSETTEGVSEPESQAVESEEAAKEEQSEPQGSSLEGKVLVINKDYNFIVINLGGKDGVKIGDIFVVSHNNKVLGEVKVEKIHDSMSAADFLSTDMKDQVREGDKVVQKVR